MSHMYGPLLHRHHKYTSQSLEHKPHTLDIGGMKITLELEKKPSFHPTPQNLLVIFNLASTDQIEETRTIWFFFKISIFVISAKKRKYLVS